MDFIVETQSEALGVVDTAASVIWRRRYFTAGAFEVYAPATNAYLSLLKRGRFITREDAPEAGIIESIKITDAEDGYYITASGPMASGLFNRRAIISPATYEDALVESIMRDLVNQNCIAADADRIFPSMALASIQGFTETATAYTTGNLLNYLVKLSQVSNIGFRVRKQGAALTFELYKGLDRSASQVALPQIIFSDEFDNLTGAEYEADDSGIVNTAIVKSADYVIAIGGGAGLDRWEVLAEVDPVTTTKEDGDGASYEIIDEAATLASMQASGAGSISYGTENFTGSVKENGLDGYRTEWDLGDIITVRSDRWGVETNVRICEIEEVYDEQGARVIPTFGSPAPSIIDLLQR